MFPSGVTFTKIQTDVYRVVETTLTTVLDALRPGVSWKQLSKLCRLHLVNECIKLKLVEDTEDESTKLEVSYVLMPHSLGHHVRRLSRLWSYRYVESWNGSCD